MRLASRAGPRGLVAAQLAAAGIVSLVAIGFACWALLPGQTRLAGTNSVRPDAQVAVIVPGRPVCQSNVVVPKDTAGVSVVARAGKRPGSRLTATLQGNAPPFYRSGSVERLGDGPRVVIPIEGVKETTRIDRFCLRARGGSFAIAGQRDVNADKSSRLTVGGRTKNGDMSLQLVRQRPQSLLSLTPAVFHRAALFRPGWVGSWTYWILAALALSLVAGAVAVMVAYGRGIPSTRFGIVAVGVVAFLSAVTWSLVAPAFQPPDEAAHYAYVESIVERGDLPAIVPGGDRSPFTRGTAQVIDTVAIRVILNPYARPPWTVLEQQKLSDRLQALGHAEREGGGGYTSAVAYSPAYYALEAGPYMAAGNGSILSRLWLMRLLSALMAAGTAALAFLFAREVFPSVPWAAPVAGLAVAFEPMFAFIGGAVNNDNLLFLVATLELLLLARALRRGLDARLAISIGLVLGLGVFVKPNMYALVPVAAGVLLWLVIKAPRRRGAVALAALAVGSFAAVIALRYGLISRDEAVVGAVGGGGSKPFQVRELLSYTWQWYLPSLPFMHDFFAGTPPAYETYFKGFWANFAHLDTKFPGWVYQCLLVACAAGIALVGAGVYRGRRRIGSILPFVALCLGSVIGLALMVNLRSYIALIDSGAPFAQGRYLLPTVAVLGAAVVGAALAFGRERGLVAATAFVTALGFLNAFSLGLVLVRFYT